MKYTSTQAIANRLRGRVAFGQSSQFGVSQIDPALIDQVGDQVEARVDSSLGQVYQMPLAQPHLELASVVEKLVICEILGTHFVGQEANPSDGYGRLMCAQGAAELEAIALASPPLTGESAIAAPVAGIAPAGSLSLAGRRGGGEEIAW
jgi:hypothetical protein